MFKVTPSTAFVYNADSHQYEVYPKKGERVACRSYNLYSTLEEANSAFATLAATAAKEN